MAVRVSFITCPGCGEEIEGIWPADDDERDPAETEQLCPCGQKWVAVFPGYSYRQEAG
jgi:hypothetical protein